ncbi:MAG: hypothetical protein AAF675_17160 [Pseudomonadota bacterium]
MAARLVIVQGFIAAGKTTRARWLGQETGALHLDTDAYGAEAFSEVARRWQRSGSTGS